MLSASCPPVVQRESGPAARQASNVSLAPVLEDFSDGSEAKTSVQAGMADPTRGIMPGTYDSQLGSFLNATSTKISQLPAFDSSGEWAIVIANRHGSLEAWSLSTEGSDALVWACSRRSGLLLFLGVTLGMFLTFGYLAYL